MIEGHQNGRSEKLMIEGHQNGRSEKLMIEGHQNGRSEKLMAGRICRMRVYERDGDGIGKKKKVTQPLPARRLREVSRES